MALSGLATKSATAVSSFELPPCSAIFGPSENIVPADACVVLCVTTYTVIHHCPMRFCDVASSIHPSCIVIALGIVLR